jgi:Na+-transporting NADH:ubiquinone oxidoreductase subunit NqrD
MYGLKRVVPSVSVALSVFITGKPGQGVGDAEADVPVSIQLILVSIFVVLSGLVIVLEKLLKTYLLSQLSVTLFGP